MILIGRGLVLADDLVDDFSFEGASLSKKVLDVMET